MNLHTCHWSDQRLSIAQQFGTHLSKGLKDQLEAVQMKAAHFVLGRPVYCCPRESVTAMVKDMGWDTLEQRRKKSNIIFMYKVLHQQVAIPLHYHPPRVIASNTRQSHEYKLMAYHTSVVQFQSSYFPRTVSVWNSLPAETVLAPSIDIFRSQVAGLSLY